MSGSLAFTADGAAAPGPHDHFDLVTSAGTLRLTDPRRFGAVVWAARSRQGWPASCWPGSACRAVRPGVHGAGAVRALKRRRVAVKAALLAGDIVVGAGNIYACEALLAAGIDPRTRAHRLSLRALRAARCRRARHAGPGARIGGSTLRDFRDASGVVGEFQLHARVYGRAGQPCFGCGTAVRRVVQGQRSTFFCARCQTRVNTA